jgi:hypothetical protein
MQGPLKQLNITFSPVEDRLMLRMTTGAPDALVEYRIWLTRRFVRVFWNTLEKVLETLASRDTRIAPDSRDAVMQFQQEAALSRANFSTPYGAENAKTPLGETPLLVSKIQVRKGPKGQPVLTMQTQKGQGVNMALNPHLVHSLRKLLADAVKKVEWDLPFSIYTAEAGPDKDKPVAHTVN